MDSKTILNQTLSRHNFCLGKIHWNWTFHPFFHELDTSQRQTFYIVSVMSGLEAFIIIFKNI